MVISFQWKKEEIITLPCGLQGENKVEKDNNKNEKLIWFCCADNCQEINMTKINFKDPNNKIEQCWKRWKKENTDNQNLISNIVQ